MHWSGRDLPCDHIQQQLFRWTPGQANTLRSKLGAGDAAYPRRHGQHHLQPRHYLDLENVTLNRGEMTK